MWATGPTANADRQYVRTQAGSKGPPSPKSAKTCPQGPRRRDPIEDAPPYLSCRPRRRSRSRLFSHAPPAPTRLASRAWPATREARHYAGPVARAVRRIGYGDDTVIVFVPEHYRFRAEEGVSALVHFHGHNTTAPSARWPRTAREQLADSRQNAVLVVPQLASFAADSSCGRLESPGGLSRMLSEAIAAAAEAARRRSATPVPARTRRGAVCLSAHSGGYHAAACSLREGGLDVRETYLFDALYADASLPRLGRSRARATPCTSATSS